MLPERVLIPLLNDRMVAKGTILSFATQFFVDFLATAPVDDLVALLKKAKLDDRLPEFFPPSQRTPEQVNAHFKVRVCQGTRCSSATHGVPSHVACADPAIALS